MELKIVQVISWKLLTLIWKFQSFSSHKFSTFLAQKIIEINLTISELFFFFAETSSFILLSVYSGPAATP